MIPGDLRTWSAKRVFKLRFSEFLTSIMIPLNVYTCKNVSTFFFINHFFSHKLQCMKSFNPLTCSPPSPGVPGSPGDPTLPWELQWELKVYTVHNASIVRGRLRKVLSLARSSNFNLANFTTIQDARVNNHCLQAPIWFTKISAEVLFSMSKQPEISHDCLNSKNLERDCLSTWQSLVISLYWNRTIKTLTQLKKHVGMIKVPKLP